jgi:hypothetical protein
MFRRIESSSDKILFALPSSGQFSKRDCRFEQSLSSDQGIIDMYGLGTSPAPRSTYLVQIKARYPPSNLRISKVQCIGQSLQVATNLLSSDSGIWGYFDGRGRAQLISEVANCWGIHLRCTHWFLCMKYPHFATASSLCSPREIPLARFVSSVLVGTVLRYWGKSVRRWT